MNRRNFLSNGLAAAAAATVGSSLAAGEPTKTPGTKRKTENPFNERTYGSMPTRAFGKTGYKIGILSLGGQTTLVEEGTEEESERIINRALDLGVNYIDTAASYGRGRSQINIGRVMKTRRAEVWLATKTQDPRPDLRRLHEAPGAKPREPANRPPRHLAAPQHQDKG